MSTEQQISAYEAFKGAKNLANSSKKNKKKQNGSAKRNNIKNGKIKKKLASNKAARKLNSCNMSDHGKTSSSKKKTKNSRSAKKLSTVDKKKSLEECLAKQLKVDDRADRREDSTSTDESDIYAGEYILNESGPLSEYGSNGEEEFLSTNEDSDQAAGSSAESKASKGIKKRKSPKKSTSNLSSAERKKLKQDDFKSRKFLSHEGGAECSKKSSASKVFKPLSQPENIVKSNSIEEGKRALKWLLNPVNVDEFFAKYWEQKACFIKRKSNSYFTHLISFESIDQMLLENHVEFSKNIDVTLYKNGVRETLNPEGRALPPIVWDHYGQGCSIRLLNPLTYMPALYTLSVTMQEYFHCLVGANVYLTPPNSQGFAPHYDDIEAFVLQIEGRKRWKLYKPRRSGQLARYSSPNFSQEEIGTPVFDDVLEPGDVLYFPRGTIHQACTEPGYHSLHITLSAYQKQSFADLFEKMLPMMLQGAIAHNVEFRKGLPLHAFQNAGVTYCDQFTKERAELVKKVTHLMHGCIRKMPLQDIMDAAIDQMAKKFQHEALPPEILPAEKQRTVFGSRNRTNERGECECDYDINERTNVRLLRANILRLVYEEKKMRIYYYSDNSKVYREYEPNFIEVEECDAASVEVLVKSYPHYVGVAQLPLPTDEQKINLVTALWERGILMMEKPFR